MQLLIPLLLLTLSTGIQAQNRTLYGRSDRMMTLVSKLDLDSIQKVPHTFHFRLWARGQIIECWQDQENAIYGQVTCWAKEFKDSFTDSTALHYYEKKELKTEQVRQLFELYDSMAIQDIPTGDSINGWSIGLDGVIYTLELANKEFYWLRSYWSPSVQGNLEEAQRIKYFVKKAKEIVVPSLPPNFTKNIPFQVYTHGGGGPGVMMRILSKKERRKLRKKRRKLKKQSQ